MNNVIELIKAGGFVMYPLMVLSLVSIGVIVERWLAYRQFGGTTPRLVPEVVRLCRAGSPELALKACERENGPVAACMAEVVRHRHLPVSEIERRVEETGGAVFLRLERFLPILDTTTTISPLLGLLGTIVGMVGTFNAVAASQARGGGNNDAILAGVGEALYATAAGLIIAMICFVAYNYFTARLRTVIGETEQAVTRVLNALSEVRETVPAALRADSLREEGVRREVQTAH